MVSGAERMVSADDRRATAAPFVSVMLRSVSAPAVTVPDAGCMPATRSPDVMITCVSRLLAWVAT